MAMGNVPLIIQRYVFRELFVTSAAVTVVLFLIFLSSWFARLLGQVTSGGLRPELLFWLLSLKSVDAMVILLPLAFYLAGLLTLGRLYKDSEMTAMLACGVSPLKVFSVVLWTGTGFALVVAAIALYFAPAAQGQRFQVQAELEADVGLEAVTAGQFRALAEGQVVFYAERLSDDGRTMENVFIQGRRDGVLNLVSAAEAFRMDDEESGAQYLVLKDGYRYEGEPGTASFQVTRFAEHGVRIERDETVLEVDARAARSSWLLWHSPSLKDQAELQWRVSMPLTTVLLGALAVFLSRTNPRQGRYAKFFVGILAYVVYSNLLSVARAWLEKGAVPVYVGMWWLHAALAVLVLALVLRQLAGARAARRIVMDARETA